LTAHSPIPKLYDSPFYRRLLAAAIGSLCLALAAMALGLGVANLASVSTHAWMREWEERRLAGEPKDWNTAYQRLKLARHLNPLNADYSADLGRLMEWQAWRYFSENAESMKYRARASQFYEEAIRKRPSWGFAWAHYAENQLLSGNRDSKFMTALEKAMLLAPWEPGVQRKVAWMGMATWSEQPAVVQDMVAESIGRTVNVEGHLEEIARLAIQYDWLDRLRPMMRTNRQSAALDRVLTRPGQR
jgi:hypothetical protein